MNFSFANLGVGKYAFLALIPLIIFYLIRPKPREVVIPSLMFIMKLTGKSKAAALFRKIVSDPLFLVQLLVILVIAFAAIEPIAKYPYDASAENTVLVIDASASMQANSRFSHAISEAKAKLDGKISIIAIKNQPDVVLEDGSRGEALRALGSLKATATTSNIGDAIQAGDDLLGDRKGKIVVISDFIDTNGADLNELRRFIESKGKIIEFIDVADKAANVGIVNVEYGAEQSTLYVKNYNDEKITVPIKFGSEDKSIDILPNSVELIPFTTAGGLNEISLNYRDDFSLDNRIYLNLPKQQKIRVLYITNKERTFLKDFLLASDNVQLDVSNPPLIPNTNYDVIIVHEVLPEKFIIAIANKLANYVDNGGKLVIAGQKDENLLDFRGLLPVNLAEWANGTYPMVKFSGDITSDVAFDKVNGYFKASKQPGVIDVVDAEDGSPLIALLQKGVSKVVYYGIIESESDFRLSTSYPVFWHKLLNYLSGISGYDDMNKKTGSYLVFDSKKTIKTPAGEVLTDRLALNDVGFYQVSGSTIAVNLLNQNESQVQRPGNLNFAAVDAAIKDKYKQLKESELVLYLLMAAIALVFLEVLYVKMRGDL